MDVENQKSPIFSCQYFGGIEFYASLFCNASCLLEHNEHYQKRSLRNRMYVLSPQGVEVLSVPLVKGKNAKLPITDVKISYDEDWPRQHLHALQSYYGKSPFLEYYIDDIEEILSSRPSHLWDLNQSLCTYICGCLSIESEIRYTEEYQTEYPNDYRDSNSGQYKQMRLDTLGKLRYNQVFEEKHGFTPHLSILDLLFCCGPESILRLSRLGNVKV